jgi:uncharacterized DUF497 family protein
VSWGLAEADFSEIVRRCSGRSPCGATRILVEVTPEWDGRKAAAHLKKYSVGGLDFEMQRPLFLDLLATTFPDPDHLLSEHREIPVLQLLRIASEAEGFISARLATATGGKQYEEEAGHG